MKYIIGLVVIFTASCGKTSLDQKMTSDPSSISSTDNSQVACKNFRPCKEKCDGEANRYYFDYCDYETRHNSVYHPACDHLNACYNKLVSTSNY